jgi:hypothetical protein
MPNAPAQDPNEPLTPAEEERLARALLRIEDQLYRAVLRRVAGTILIVTAVLVGSIALVGWLSWSSLRKRLVEDAVSTFQTDDSLRSDLLAGLGIDTAGYARLLEMLEQVETLGTGAVGTDREMAELQRMLESMLGEPTPTLEGPPRRR